MASNIVLQEALVMVTFLLLQVHSSPIQSCSPYTSIYSFGDSYADTGNREHMFDEYDTYVPKNLPYGMTYFHHPAGRYTNGRVVVDFLAEAMGLPFVSPFVGGRDYRKGVNFAVGGATALNSKYLLENRIYDTSAKNSLGVQIEWFKQIVDNLCPKTEKRSCNAFTNSLFVLGEIGGNDYQYGFKSGKTREEVVGLIPLVVKTIKSALQTLVNNGAKTIVVPGQIPMGCMPVYLNFFSTNSTKDDYNSTTGCINWLNEFSQNQNHQLQVELQKLRPMNPKVTIIYADYYNSFMPLYESPQKFGFKRSLIPCCTLCGKPGMKLCSDPSKYASWDGIHMTEASYKIISRGLINGTYTYPSQLLTCRGVKALDENKHQVM